MRARNTKTRVGGWWLVAAAVLALGLAVWLIGYFSWFCVSDSAAGKLADLGAGILGGGVVATAFAWMDDRNQSRHEAELFRLQLGLQADLTGLDLKDRHLDGISLAGKKMQYANLSGCSLVKASMTRVDLSEADLTGAKLLGARLQSAILTGATLIDTDLRDVDFTGANLAGATCVGADFLDADLTDADLTGSDLSGANLNGAKVTRAQILSARIGPTTSLPFKM